MNTSNNHHYNKKLKTFANANRKQATKAEACLWKYVLKNRMMLGYQFRRQRPIGNYIADFACLPLKLVIETDGLTHDNPEVQAKDEQRDVDLAALNFTTLRFSDWQVLNHIETVRYEIEAWIKTNAKVLPPPPRKRKSRS